MAAVKGPSVGVPVKLFREAESHPVTVELKTGEIYRGTLEESEDSMSCLLKNVHHTSRDGRVVRLEAVYLRGSQIRFVVLPEVLKGAPLFQCVLCGLGSFWGPTQFTLCSFSCLYKRKQLTQKLYLLLSFNAWLFFCVCVFLRRLQEGEAVCRKQSKASPFGSWGQGSWEGWKGQRTRRSIGYTIHKFVVYLRDAFIVAPLAPSNPFSSTLHSLTPPILQQRNNSGSRNSLVKILICLMQ